MNLKKLFKNIKFVFNIIIKDISSLGSLVFFAFIIVFEFAQNNYNLSLKLLISLFLAYSIVILIRSIYYKQRPNKQKYKNFLEKIDSSSFPSMHSLRITLISFFLINYYYNFLILILFVGISLMVGFSRFYLKKHYISDIIFGYFLGFLIYFLINYIFLLF